MKKGNEKKKGGCIKYFLTTFILIMVIFVVLAITSSGSGGDESVETSDLTTSPSADPEPNTSAMVDYIASEAKKSANEGATGEKRDEAINYIVDNYPNYFTDNDVMEKTMYYGYYLEYAYAQNGPENLYANLGMDAYQAVKYVYRNTETTEDDHVQENLRQIKETLGEMGYSVE